MQAVSMHTLFVQEQTRIILLCYHEMLQRKRSLAQPHRLSTPSRCADLYRLTYYSLPIRTMCDVTHVVILQGRCLLQHLPIWCCLLPFLPFTPMPFASCRPCCGPAKPLCCYITPPWPGCSAVCFNRWLHLLLRTLPRQQCNSDSR